MTERFTYPLDQWCYEVGKPAATGMIRASPEDFQVTEEMGFEPEGSGRHLWLYIEKTLLNSVDIASQLGRLGKVHGKEVGLSGQKDRNAVTRQWFSVLAEKDPEGCLSRIEAYCEKSDGINLLERRFHSAKLKTGSHRFNHFRIKISDFSGDRQQLEDRLTQIRASGVANYFGEQRFGRNGKNMQTVARWFSGEKLKLDRQARSMALSSARSWLFNEVLSRRIAAGDWRTPSIGDVMMLDGTRSWFLHDGSDPLVVDRIRDNDLHITGPLWGKGDLATQYAIRSLEREVAAAGDLLATGLEKQGLMQQRRALRVVPVEFNWCFPADNEVVLEFGLPRGAFATAVLRELISYS